MKIVRIELDFTAVHGRSLLSSFSKNSHNIHTDSTDNNANKKVPLSVKYANNMHNDELTVTCCLLIIQKA